MLTSEQVKKNQEKYGFNELAEGKKKSTLQIFLEQFKDFLVIILLIAATVSGFLGDIESTVVIIVVVCINAVLGTVQTLKAESSLQSLKQLSAPNAKVRRDREVVSIPSREVTVGDEVLLEAGDCIPADGKLMEVASLKVDESALTGESVSVEKSLEEAQEGAAIGDQTDNVFSGSFVTYGRAVYEVTAIGMETEVGKIAGLLKATEQKKTPLQVSLDQFGKKLSLVILVFCGILFLLNIFRGGNVADAFLFAVALAVAAIPEALSSIVTIVLSIGTQKMAKEHAIVRKLHAVEGLGSVSIICSDKTGTLTQNRMTVTDYMSEEENRDALVMASVLCNDGRITEEEEIGDPTETALLQSAIKLGIKVDEMQKSFPRVGEIPFDSDRKLMSTLHVIEGKPTMFVKGAVDVLLSRMEITEEEKTKIGQKNLEYSKEGLRVLAYAYKEIDEVRELTLEDENNLTFIGLSAMMDPPREESAQAVQECIDAGIRPIMITGDHKITASAIAKKIGILTDDSQACEGAAIENMTDEELEHFVEGISVYARVSPEHKIRIVRAWQNKGNIVSMTGDGVNDAPALKQADIGVAMGITGSEVAKDAASMVLTDDNFATIVKAVENGRNIYRNIKNAIGFLLSGNFGAIVTVLVSALAGWAVPFAPVHLLFINLLTDSLPAIALGMEPHTKEVMKEKPRQADESILTKDFLIQIGVQGVSIGIMTIAAYWIGYASGNITLARTMAFGTLCVSRLFHGFNCKTVQPVLFTKRMFENIYLIGATVLGIVLIVAVLMIPALHSVFQVATLSGLQLLAIFGLAFLHLCLMQILKAIGKFRHI